MDQSSLVSKPALLPVVFSNEATTIVGIIMSVETQCATTSHFNLTFERLMEFGILMSDDSLDPEKHSSVTFKENFSPISVCTVEGARLLALGNDSSSVKGQSASKKNGLGRVGRKLTNHYEDSIRVKLVQNHPQFILIRVLSSIPSKSIFIVFVFGNLVRQKRKFLWDTSKSSIPSVSIPWMAIGDW
ncbi:hypothetical protein Godav_001370 [Gossypium davidsonii]|uniref:Uncharacterized protein n=1 Tax=Gossypium davidsonii TaxID=34287 RepID=A0A7J8T3Q1_GOSDV|nr:hypothetical protein [Gossypium davidsonii]